MACRQTEQEVTGGIRSPQGRHDQAPADGRVVMAPGRLTAGGLVERTPLRPVGGLPGDIGQAAAAQLPEPGTGNQLDTISGDGPGIRGCFLPGDGGSIESRGSRIFPIPRAEGGAERNPLLSSSGSITPMGIGDGAGLVCVLGEMFDAQLDKIAFRNGSELQETIKTDPAGPPARWVTGPAQESRRNLTVVHSPHREDSLQ